MVCVPDYSSTPLCTSTALYVPLEIWYLHPTLECYNPQTNTGLLQQPAFMQYVCHLLRDGTLNF